MAPCSGNFAHITLHKSYHSLRKWVIISLSSKVTLPYITQWVISWEKTSKSLLFPLYHFCGIKYNSIFMGIFFLPVYSSTTFHWITTSGAISYFCLYSLLYTVIKKLLSKKKHRLLCRHKNRLIAMTGDDCERGRKVSDIAKSILGVTVFIRKELEHVIQWNSMW